jgi:hypothetical protein
MRARTGILIVALLAPAAWPAARALADTSISATLTPAVTAVGDQVVLTVKVEGKFRRGEAPELPPLDDFQVFESGSSQNFSFVNGQMSASLTYTYVLSPLREGTYTIEPISLTAGGKRYTANPVTLEVTAAARAVPAPGAPPPSSAQEPKGALPDAEQSIFIAATVDRDTVYVNQQVTWTLAYYADGRVNLLRSPNYTPPSAEGFWVEDLPPQAKSYTTLHGRQYLVSEIKRGYFPTAPGTHTIGEARVDVVIGDASRGRSVFDDFFNRGRLGSGFGRQHALVTQPREIVVLPLPRSGKPAGFSGVVARDLTVAASVDKQVVQVGEPINLTVEVAGAGNIKTLPPPALPPLDRFKVYESGSSAETFKRDYVVTGRKRYEYVLVPQVEGKVSIPPVRLSYFDPAVGRYGTAASYAVSVEVQPGTREEGRKVIYAGGGDDFEVITRDIRYIHAVPSAVAVAPRAFYQSTLYAGAHALPLLAVVASMLVERRRRRIREDVAYARASRALKAAQRRLDTARRALARGDADAALAGLAGAVTGYFADKMNAAAAGLTADAVAAHLSGRGADATVVDEVRRLMAACDAARYAGAPSGEAAAGLLETTRRVLREVDKREGAA